MKVSFNVQFLLGQRFLKRAEKFQQSFNVYLDLASEVVTAKSPDYIVNLSPQLNDQKLARTIRDLNVNHSNQRHQQEEIPPALSELHEKPNSDFETFFKTLTENPLKLLEAHRAIDPKIVLSLLTE